MDVIFPSIFQKHTRALLLVVHTYKKWAYPSNADLTPESDWHVSLLRKLQAASPLLTLALLEDNPPYSVDLKYAGLKGQTPAMCLTKHLSAIECCFLNRTRVHESHQSSINLAKAAVAPFNRTFYLPTTNMFCGQWQCPLVVGDTLVSLDGSHITFAYAALLGPQLAALLQPLW
jgi:hypothetical protein